MSTHTNPKELNDLLIEAMQMVAEARTDPDASEKVEELLNQSLHRLGQAFALTRAGSFGISNDSDKVKHRLDRVFLNNEQFFSVATGNPDLDLISLGDGPIPCVVASPGQLEFVVFSALVICRELVGGNRPMTVTLDQVAVDLQKVNSVISLPAGRYAAIAVQCRTRIVKQLPHATLYDQVLISAQDAENVSCGLGTVQRVVESMNGALVYDCTDGHSPVLVIYLPLSELDMENPVQEDESFVQHDETVLLVDDDPMVRRYTRRALEVSGFRVLEAANSREAMETIRQEEGQIDILIADLVLPDMHGGKLATAIDEEFGRMPVIFVSGYDNRAIQHHGLIEQGASLLTKPYTRRSLLTMVEAALEVSS
ncbi:MAG: two-component system cell cycle sensor histidine kinase/response regulator CckA [Planctomycetota bacterium]